jgi:hypothetical protein
MMSGGGPMAIPAEVAVVARRDERRDHLALAARERARSSEQELGKLPQGLRGLRAIGEAARDPGQTFR